MGCETFWDVDRQPLAAALDWLGTTVLSPRGATLLVGRLLITLWREAPTDQHAGRATRRICDRLRRRDDGHRILNSLYQHLDLFFGLDILRADKVSAVIADCLRAGPRPLQLPLPERWAR